MTWEGDDMPPDVVGTDPLALLSVFAERDHDVLVAAVGARKA